MLLKKGLLTYFVISKYNHNVSNASLEQFCKYKRNYNELTKYNYEKVYMFIIYIWCCL